MGIQDDRSEPGESMGQSGSRTTGQSPVSSRVCFGLFEANLETGELHKSGIRIRIQAQPFRILTMLLERPGEVVTREEIQQRLWGDNVIVDFDHSLGTAINKIRDALGDTAENPRFIETLARRGYRFIAPVSVSSMAVALGEGESAAQEPARAVWPRWIWWAAGAAVLLAGVAVAFVAGRFSAAVSGPLPPPLITQVTFSGRVSPNDLQFESLAGTATDGSRIYFSEIENGQSQIAQALIADGETSLLGVPSEIAAPALGDISPDGSKLLLRNHLTTSAEQALWIVSTIGGDARRVPGVLAHDATWMPDGNRILYAKDNDLYIGNEDGTGVEKFATLPGRAFWLRWSPDGSVLRFTLLNSETHATALWQIAADGKESHPLLPGWNSPPAECCGSWTADGRYYVFQSTRDGNTNIWQMDEKPGWFGSSRPLQLTNGPLSFQAPITARSGERIFFIGLNTRSELLGYDAKRQIFAPYASYLSNARKVSYSHNRHWVAWVKQDDGTLWRSRVDGSQRMQLTAKPMKVFLMHWSPNGHRLLVMGHKPGDLWRLYMVDAEGGHVHALLHEDRNEADPTWSADGKTVAFGRLPQLMSDEPGPDAIYLLNLATKKVSELPGSEGLFSPRWSPDGRYIAAITHDQTKLMLYDTTTKKWRVLTQGYLADPVWSNAGKAIYFHDFVQPEQPIYKLTIADDHKTLIAGLSDLRSADAVDYRFAGMAPGGVPLVNVRLSTANIYSAHVRQR
ncbi:MAG TPA: winged helix-turn-helix domain-containing protein [Acidobacteriaceae bacterium]|nr:winged helix-turn-helix domain-containing protein [Acidobacteriaceae bacterium]